jgi:hypothetical protein
METPVSDLKNVSVDKRIELFQVEELEMRFEMEPWVNLNMDLVINVVCEVYFPGPDKATIPYYYTNF